MDTIKIKKGNVKMVAHRGLSGIEQQNTCAAFVAAGNRDYYGIETDVRKTADGAFVVIHDETTERVADEKLAVATSTLEQLQAIRLNDKDGKARSDLRIPTLDEYLKICAKYGKVCVLELKDEFSKEDIESILAIVKNHMTLNDIIFISFMFQNMIYIRELEPEAQAQFLYYQPVDEAIVEKLKAYNLDIDIAWTVLDQKGAELLHENGIKVNVWTVDDPAVAEQMAAWGIEYITSNICSKNLRPLWAQIFVYREDLLFWIYRRGAQPYFFLNILEKL